MRLVAGVGGRDRAVVIHRCFFGFVLVARRQGATRIVRREAPHPSSMFWCEKVSEDVRDAQSRLHAVGFGADSRSALTSRTWHVCGAKRRTFAAATWHEMSVSSASRRKFAGFKTRNRFSGAP